MENINMLSMIGYACLAGLILIIVIPVVFMIYKSIKKINDISNEAEIQRQSILKGGGLVAPALIHSVTRLMGDRHTHIIDFVVDVQPEGGAPFRASFRDAVGHEHFSMIGRELIGHSGRRIWVAYDPSNLSRVVLDHFDEQNEEILLNQRRGEFNKLTEGNEELKKTGEQAEAIITGVDDLNLPYPLKNGRAMRLYFDVMPRFGSVFRAEANVLIGDIAVEKYSVGKTVYIRFDRLNPQRAVLDSERNKSI